MGVAALFGAVTMLLLTAAALAACLRLRSLASFALAAYLFAWTEIVGVTYLLSIGRRLERPALLVALATVTVAALAVWVTRGRPIPPYGHWARQVRALAEDGVLVVLGAAVALSYAYTAALAVTTAPNDGDPLVYELMRAALWQQQDGVGALETAYDTRLDASPPHAEMGQLMTMVLSGTERFVAVGQFTAVLALALGIAGIARRLGLPPREAVFGALLVPLLPVVLVQSWTGLTDLVFSAFFVAAVYFILGRARSEVILFGLAVGLAIGTKFLGPILLPLVAVVVVFCQPPRRFVAFALAGAAGGVLGGTWYVANILWADRATGSFEESDFQPFGLEPILGSLSRYLTELFDLSGSIDADVLLYVVVGGVLVVAGLVLRLRRMRGATTALVAGALVTATPLLVAVVHRILSRTFEATWSEAGSNDLERWFARVELQTVSDGVLSWYGPVGAVLAIGALPLAVVAKRRGGVGGVALVLAASPAIAMLCLAVTVNYGHYQGRYVISGVALCASVWGVLTRWSSLKLAVATASIVTAGLCLVNSLGKPPGFDLIHTDSRPSVWSMPRWEQQGLLRWSPSERDEINTMRFVEHHVPLDAGVGLALRENDFGFPYFGPNLTRHITIVDAGDEMPRAIGWLVAGPGRTVDTCSDAWRRSWRTPSGWRVFRRIAPQERCDE